MKKELNNKLLEKVSGGSVPRVDRDWDIYHLIYIKDNTRVDRRIAAKTDEDAIEKAREIINLGGYTFIELYINRTSQTRYLTI